jgi:tetratricopeptide (TPR) repeat protein
MFPVIGLIQVGYQSMADRYAYIPLMGLFIIMVWGGADIMEKVFKPKRFMPYIISFAFVGILTLIASNQIRYWESSEVLFRHAMQVTTNNHIAIAGIGNEYLKKGKMEEAALYLLEAIKIMPDYPEAHNNLGIVYLKQSKLDEAIYEFGEAVKYKPSLARAHNNMGVALSMKGNYRDAIVKYHDALREDPNYINAKENLTKTLYNYHHNKISGHP